MIFNITPQEAKEKWKQYFRYEVQRDAYIIQIYEDTDNTCGFLEESDCILMFTTNNNNLCACIERLEKKKYDLLERFRLLLNGKRKLAAVGDGIETFIYKKGDFIEFQMYKRWWYDIANNNGDFFKYAKSTIDNT